MTDKSSKLDFKQAQSYVDQCWQESILPALVDYVRIPNKSPDFAPDWEADGHMDRAAGLLADWCRSRAEPGMCVEIVRLPGRTPLLLMEIPASSGAAALEPVLLYGHFDKQPEFSGWAEGLGPWNPVVRDGKLYGRGGGDDGYAVFASLTAIEALRRQGLPHARCVILIEGCEESGSTDLPHYLEALSTRIGTPGLVVCLDAECSNYDQLWVTTSLRGGVIGTLSVEVLTEGVHSGLGTGIAPSVFRVLRTLLSRIEDEVTGDLRVDELYADIPAERRQQAELAAGVLGEQVFRKVPFADGVEPISNSMSELVLNSTWRPSLTVTGMDGLPAVRDGGNVLLPRLAAKLSLRLAPTADPARAAGKLRELLEADPPYGSRVTFETGMAASGWDAPPLAPWLADSARRASQAVYGRDAMYLGCGGSIPFIDMLGRRFPRTQFLITGVLGPASNAHGPNEFLHLSYAQRLTTCVAGVLADHAPAAGAR